MRPAGSRLPAEEGFFELLIDTLEGLDRPARGLFLQRLFRSITQLELTPDQSLDYWERVVERRKELTNLLGRVVSLKTALVDVFAYENFLRVPILMEYEELKKLQINAATDPLTGLYNRRLFEEYFDKELNRSQRNQQTLSLMILDLHVFKQVNDRFGHLRGDQVLQMAAAALRSSMRTSDYAFRIGGDEFALLLPQSDAEQAGTLGRRLQAKFIETVSQLNLDLPLAIDFGLGVYPQDGEQMSVLLRAADQRLYQMKGTSRRDRSRPIAAAAAAAGEAHLENAGTETPSAPAVERRVSFEAPAPAPEAAAQEPTPAVPSATPEPPEVVPARPSGGAERRKTERIALTRTHAHAQMAGTEAKIRILDLSNGGLALETEEGTELTESFQAILHVPILPAVRVHLKPVYKQALGRGFSRVGCSFVA
jgi:diguanylate cyclase (GGDEF)-like protein